MPFPSGRANGPDSNKNRAVLLAATVWWPLSAKLAVRFVDYGCRISAVCPKGHLLRHVAGLERVFPYSGLSSLDSLEEAIRKSAPDIIVPCDDRVVWQLHELYNRKPDLRPLIEASLGAADGFEIVERRDLLLETAQSLGIRIPTTRLVTSEEEVHAWFAQGEHSAVVKLDGTWGGEGVAIAHSEREAKQAFRRFSKPAGIGTAIKRLLVNRDPLSLWSWKKQSPPIITIQQLIAGRPANSMLACWQGEVLAMVSVEVLASQGETGAAFLVRIIESEEMTQAAHRLAKRLELTGFVGLDFLIEDATGQPHLIEMNPRCTQLGHLPLAEGGDLAGALSKKLGCEACAGHAASVEGKLIAFFPQAARWQATNPLAAHIYNDAPQGQPGLVGELMRPAWPERQWTSRIYHFFRPPRPIQPVEFRFDTAGKEFAPEIPADYETIDSPPRG